MVGSPRRPSGGATIDVRLDPAAGSSQEYVEDCPVCCRPNVRQVWFGDGVRIDATSE
ncbi:MAG TPA: CPXCG motif-containing cysteine-rich protein [Gammaproteobacteria bacterium]|nr:CPXCG motif-containing cysteine-rich protein [Gammaproteobacteria bacterium]HJP39678.1 CPXCG motif-containing cysteine-rich protein [Gammaproteobacteria bacterium]